MSNQTDEAPGVSASERARDWAELQVAELRERSARNVTRAPESPRTAGTFTPTFAPFGLDITAGMVEEVWTTYVKPEQDAERPQSGEMRVLMGILREAWRVLTLQEQP